MADPIGNFVPEYIENQTEREVIMKLAKMVTDRVPQKLGMKKLTIFHDYEGTAAWVLGKWKCKKPETRRYAMVMWKAMDAGLRIYFNHVKGHSGNWGNDEADQLAKLAVGLEVK